VGEDKSEVDRVARLLMEAWEQAEQKAVGISYVATFADMARAVIADRAELSVGGAGAAGAGRRGVGGRYPTELVITVARWAGDCLVHTGGFEDTVTMDELRASLRVWSLATGRAKPLGSSVVLRLVIAEQVTASGGTYDRREKKFRLIRLIGDGAGGE